MALTPLTRRIAPRWTVGPGTRAFPQFQRRAPLADARRLAGRKPKGAWPPRFVGMIKDGPKNGSSPESIDAVLSPGFDSERG